ncbi:uncharacterized protein LOC124170112 isoform X1 [Ischnura elegans]|uniref:uncharacterized protein LOC124170112 isoform X1 n=2 Tax=Ischnura elegans TaxID=197161 RepID=UPI001ED88A91|nr:uncharacterized protein LOC124170112 isoform X1 [Ischnura elegans]XP_046404746.1 uncharacterized protein LOC124170112 isoform X1 [Ischnura elegans]XP_046404747.1 uncharacterized protein LOC124170112 isoform X1 [Ischnura elegans]
MGWPRCCVPGCGENKKLRFRFPHPYSDRHKRFAEWLKRIGDEKLNKMDPKKVYENKRICYRHFFLTDYEEGTHILKRDAIPSRFPVIPRNTVKSCDSNILAPGKAGASSSREGSTALSSKPEPVTGVNGKQVPANTKTEELISLGDDQTPESSSISTVEINTSLFGRISQDLALHRNINPILLPPDDESGATASPTEPLVIDIVVPGTLDLTVQELSTSLPPNPSVSPAWHDRNVPGSETGCSALVPVSTCASDSAVICDSGVKCPDEINQGTVVLPCGTPAEKTVESSSLERWKADIRDGVDNSADDCHLFSIPGSDFAHDAQLEGGENVVEEVSTLDEHVGITEPDADDGDSSRDSIFSHYIARASPPPEKTRTIDGIAVEQLAKTLLAGYADVSVVPVSDPYYRFKLCRLCFRAGKRVTMIYGGAFTDYNLKDAIEDMMRFQVSTSDDYPQVICDHCLLKLTKFKRFKEQFREAKEFFDEELRRNNKTVDEGGGLSSNKVVSVQPVEPSVDKKVNVHPGHRSSMGEEAMMHSSATTTAMDVEAPCTSTLEERLRETNTAGEQTDHDMSAHEEFHDEADVSSDDGRWKAEDEDKEWDQGVVWPLVVPVKKRSNEGAFECRTCGENFVYKNRWKDHMREHEKGYPYPCTYCDRRYKDLPSLNSHIVTHSDYKPFECELCSKRFRRPKDLLVHKNKHEGLRQHLCADCGKAFVDLAGLLRHERIHKNRPEFICNICNREFSHSHGLRSHMEVHQKDEMFTCELCSKQYASRRKLVKHLNYMHGPKREFPCDVCNKVFACKENLSYHRRRHFGLPPRIRKPRVPVK